MITKIDPHAPTRALTAKSAYIALLFASPIVLVFVFLGKWEMGIGAWGCVALVLIVVRTHWDLRTSWWFWASIAFSTVVQVPLIVLIPWGNRDVTGITILPIVLLDYAIVYGSVKVAEKMMKNT